MRLRQLLGMSAAVGALLGGSILGAPSTVSADGNANTFYLRCVRGVCSLVDDEGGNGGLAPLKVLSAAPKAKPAAAPAPSAAYGWHESGWHDPAAEDWASEEEGWGSEEEEEAAWEEGWASEEEGWGSEEQDWGSEEYGYDEWWFPEPIYVTIKNIGDNNNTPVTIIIQNINQSASNGGVNTATNAADVGTAAAD